MSALYISPTTISDAKAFVELYHRHNKPPVGGLFAVAADEGALRVGVAIVGRPVARRVQNGTTAEITRVCVREDAPKGTNSALYAACWRAARALGWLRLITYTLQEESGASLRGAGFRRVKDLPANRPGMWMTREGRAAQDVVGLAKVLWEQTAGVPFSAQDLI